MKKLVSGNLVMYITFDDTVGQAIYTIFDYVNNTVQTIYNKQKAEELFYA